MQLQFNKSSYPCVQKILAQAQNQEQTQELKLSDDMPDIGRVLCTWGQILIRSKEWRPDGFSVSYGVMVWVLYIPEDGGEVKCVETWIPGHMKWDLPGHEEDGVIRVFGIVRGLDARSISSRKLMVRVGVSILGEAYVNGDVEVYTPCELPEDIQILQKCYPIRIVREAGEKMFSIEESLTLPSSCPKMQKLIRYSIHPELIDQKVMADKIVFRGATIIRLLYCAEDGKLHRWNFEVPFSQFAELKMEYEEDASVNILPAVTSMELECEDNGNLHLKVGMTMQYLLYNRQMMNVVEDIYSPVRNTAADMESMEFPMILDEKSNTVHIEHFMDLNAADVVDTDFYPEFPTLIRQLDHVEADLAGNFQLLYYDHDGQLHGATPYWNMMWSVPSDINSRLDAYGWSSGIPQTMLTGDGITARGDIVLNTVSTANQGMSIVTGITADDKIEQSDDRPSLIIRRAGDDSLWDIAKSSGSTVEAIKNANNIQAEPDSEQMLLIPVV